MRAWTVTPGLADSAQLLDVPEPAHSAESVLVRTHAIGVCGTDREILRGLYGAAPPGETHLILGHESIGKVLAAPAGAELQAGDWVAAIVRRPDPVPCRNCAAGEWDMCRNGQYTERGIKGRHGFASDVYRVEPEFAVKVPAALGALGVLIEPASVVAKAWEHIERIGARACFQPERVLVTGAGPIGMLAALMGVQRGLDVHVLDRIEAGPKPALVRDLGAVYHCARVEELGQEWDIVLECTGASAVVLAAVAAVRADGIVCLTGVSSGGAKLAIDVGAVSRALVLENNVVFGSVNANRRHYEQAVAALTAADRAWLERLITRRVPADRWQDAFAPHPNDVKTILVFHA